MGYYTFYELNVADCGTERYEDIEVDFYNKFGKKFDLSEEDPFYSLSREELKWYDHENDMIEFSKQHPTVKFELYGDGEDSDDHWVEYFWNGEHQYCGSVIVYNERTLW